MATQTIVTCDVHGDGLTPATTLRFGVDGEQYEVDLCEPHASELRGVLARYVEVARSGGSSAAPGGRQRRARPARASSDNGRGDVSDIRTWAKSQGLEVSDRGRIPAAIRQAYEERNAKGRRRKG